MIPLIISVVSLAILGYLGYINTKLRKKLRESITDKANLVHNVSTPISIIESIMHGIDSTGLTDKQKDHIAVLMKNILDVKKMLAQSV